MKNWQLPAFVGVTVIVLSLIAHSLIIEARKDRELEKNRSLANSMTNNDPIQTQQDSLVNPDTMEMNATTAPMNTNGRRESATNDSVKFGFIKSIDTSNGGVTTITFDEAKFMGEEGRSIATKEYGCDTANPTGSCLENGTADLPNGFYIHNPSKQEVKFVLNENTIVRVIDFTNPQIGLGIRVGKLSDVSTKISDPSYDGPPFWIRLTDGKISEIEEQYLP